MSTAASSSQGGAAAPAPWPAGVLGRYQRRPPVLAQVVNVVLLAVAVVALGLAVQDGAPSLIALYLLLVLAAAASVWLRHRQPPVVTTLDVDGARVSPPGGAQRQVAWGQVPAVRTFTRSHVAPQLLAAGGQVLSLVAVPEDVARTLARHLPAVVGRPVAFEVDGRPGVPSLLDR